MDDYKVIKVDDIVSARQFGIELDSYDYSVLQKYVDKIKTWMSDDYKYGSSLYDKKKLEKYIDNLNRVLEKYGKRVE
jgi:hypothetical protein